MESAESESRVAGVLLAAGSARRMGRAKQLLPLRGKPLLGHCIDAAASSRLDELVVVLGAEAERIAEVLSLSSEGRVRYVVAKNFEAGLSASLRAGIRALGPDAAAAAILLGDQPGVGAAAIDHILHAFEGSALPIARPMYGETPGHPVVVARSLWSEFEALQGDRGLAALLPVLAGQLLAVPLPGDPPPDVDTPVDYRAMIDADSGLG